MAKTKAEIQSEYSKRTGYASQKKYEAENVHKMMLRLNKNTDADIIQALAVDNPQRELRRLLRIAIQIEQNQK
ncbi:MAG: hypothetical protein E7549_04850 [Ruminococcaceae bacterium]|nr:hypothetical protein [Oscillospiraceae bacterium]